MISLLAPAGNAQALHAALCGGADEIYLGLDRFNARRSADNFRLDDLAEVCRQAHLRGARIFVTLNTIVFQREFEDCLNLAFDAYRCGVDGFICADVGLITTLADRLPEARLHLSTQLSLTDGDDMEAAARLGASRVTLARELSLEEIRELARRAQSLGVEVEVFAHGALCVCYSGQCLLSSMIGGRSANRGTCAQACRLPYELIDEAGRKIDAPGPHLLSPKDLCLRDHLAQLQEAGVASIKIEGRMKSADYVATVTSAYRVALDQLNGIGDAALPPDQARRNLEEAFSRGFTAGLFAGERGNALMSYDRPNNRGVAVGRVKSVRDQTFRLAPTRSLNAGDVLEVWTRRGRVSAAVEAPCEAKRECHLAFDGRPGDVRAGDRVFRVRNASLVFEAKPQEPRVPVEGVASYRTDEPLRVSLWPTPPQAVTVRADTPPKEGDSDEGRFLSAQRAVARRLSERFGAGKPEVCAEGPLSQPARTKALTAAELHDHVDRLGQTPFRLTALDAQVDEGLGLGFSAIHKTRAAAVEALEKALTAPWDGRDQAAQACRAPAILGSAPAEKPHKPSVAVLATNAEAAVQARAAGADEVIVPAICLITGEQTDAGALIDGPAQPFPADCTALLSPVAHDPVGPSAETRRGVDQTQLIAHGRSLVAGDIGQLLRAHDAGAHLAAGPQLPIMNDAALGWLETLNVQRLWLSPELTLRQIADLGAASPLELGIAVMGAQELMVCEHCALMSEGPCESQCESCPRRRRPHKLRDGKGYEFPVLTDGLGRSHLYNAVPLDATPWISDLLAAGVSAFLVDATWLSPQQTRQAAERVREAIARARDGREPPPKTPGATTGHLFRGPA